MPDIKSVLRTLADDVKKMFEQDLSALSDEAVTHGFAGDARAAVDFSYEVAVVNRRFATVIRGETPGPWPFEGWAVAPEGFRTAESAKAEVSASIDALVAAVDALPDEELTKEITRPDGSTANPLAMFTFCLIHTSYHDGQLNYLQSLRGDTEVHWK
jgi:uncharacterized damage-inducible protein DinB